jgi:hypothetical protein
MLRRTIVCAVAALLVGASAACDGGDDQPSAGEEQTDLCDALGDLRASLSDLGDLGPDSTIEDFKDARARVAADVDAVVDAAGELGDTRYDELDAATDELRREIEGLDEDTTLREAATTIRDAIAELASQGASLFSGVDCDEET